MRIQSSLSPSILISTVLSGLAAATGNFDCKQININGYKYDLSPLAGAHTLYHVESAEGYTTNTTYVLNICNILGKSSIRGDMRCGTSKNVCGFRHEFTDDGLVSHSHAFPIAGLDPLGQGTKDSEIKRLKEMDSAREGLLLKLAGGEYSGEEDLGDKKKKKKKAAAVIEFQCDPDRSGLEGLVAIDDEPSTETRLRAREDKEADKDKDKEKEKEKDPNDGADPSHSLQFKSFGLADDDMYVLRLDWRTRYACDNYLRDNKGDSSSGWGFFTWLIIIVFLCVAGYLILGSWLNYNRYGARGWDLLPHGDTLRDIPYIFNDWLRRVINTLQGSGSRGGYSAV
ncbi:autophagy-related protein 27 [Aspergillus clavatus NRRL 1]|uniref:Autophagy-related protein 27 n=1 Tax=Aspergillus clavatus (strain ATCC 1007 / CBS 513.65 / DSM 816 / NCTC 3887 / NRRL 1 / QM 1276 / 107) TaxID=344612 RepID=A1CNT9_ASPCL|nr:autophagy protein Atg27, putative [Aspergillus clavatus NRRL 1]EAW07310.1 autophagy protein Atg27, putative [Aspergillus clavatus NRRL 1]